ncbi:MAG: hypothetical protein FWD05_14080 [Oscillospiraceae bacterium]|nr:hypothetical protein [Oscillospiraceae bacterium]
MKSTVLSQHIGNIDDRLIQEADVFANKSRKTQFTKKFVTALVAAALVLSLTTAAMAAAGVIDFNSIFQSIFNNERAIPYIQTDDDITEHAGEGDAIVQDVDGEIAVQYLDNELEVEIVSAFADHGIYLEMQFTGALAGSLSDNITLINRNEEWGFYEAIGGGTVAQRIDVNTTVANILLHSWVEEMYRIRFNMIASGVQFVEMGSTDMNVGEHIGMENSIVLPGRVVEVTELDLNGSVLNITYQESDLAIRGTGEFRVGVMTPSGEVFWAELGEVTPEIRNGTINIGDADPNSLVFVWGGLQAERIIRGNWDFTVTIDARPEPGRFIGEYAGMRTEVAITATTVRVYLRDLMNYGTLDEMLEFSNEVWEMDNSLVLYLADGTIVMPRLGASEGGLFAYDMEFTHPEDVVRLTFRGVQIGG